MKKLIILFLMVVSISFAQELEKDDLNDEFSEFTTPKESFDPLAGYNRAMTSFNHYIYLNVLEPTADGYAKVVPKVARTGISNFIDNIKFPIRFVNNILQLKFDYALEELGRFAINSTVGIAGLMDPATKMNLKQRDEDFGQTLGFYGAGEGFHLVLPFLGPSNLRDTFGLVADGYISPLTDTGSLDYKIPNRTEKTIGIQTVNIVNNISLNQGRYEAFTKDAIDLYSLLKNAYNQRREKEIKE
ncbi:ABC transporter [Arcobacter sp. CECT 8983]|uniref:MlaA family lipoprotein n=1 Tax=Arcobacter sp. CECT 8983 TaxID=2044508 RepID=UPI00100A4C3E|nr:VacJ family lipoprotein [Arcobacter sp. CECT 8983]RXJ88858.1 ABC transporter [Arcobacter sp. CECT 8983]